MDSPSPTQKLIHPDDVQVGERVTVQLCLYSTPNHAGLTGILTRFNPVIWEMRVVTDGGVHCCATAITRASARPSAHEIDQEELADRYTPAPRGWR